MTTIEQTLINTSTVTTSTEELCNDNYNTAQFVLIIISLIFLIAATILFHLTFHASKETLKEKIILALAIVVAVSFLVVGIVYWANQESNKTKQLKFQPKPIYTYSTVYI